MQIVLLRVGIDTGCGGIYAPIFKDKTFEFMPIPDGWSVDSRTYGNTKGRYNRRLVEYFPFSQRSRASRQAMHVDPEFSTHTYGDPTPPKSSLRKLESGDILAFYAGLKGWNCDCQPALYLVGYFEVSRAGVASDFKKSELRRLFSNNFHVKHREVFADQRERLVLVKGGPNSRLLRKAFRISSLGTNRDGRPLHRLSTKMQRVFGDFDGHTSIERSPPRWVSEEFTEKAARFLRSLR